MSLEQFERNGQMLTESLVTPRIPVALPPEASPVVKFSGRFETDLLTANSPRVPDMLEVVAEERHASESTARAVAELAIVYV